MRLAGVGGEFRLALCLEAFEDFAVLIIVTTKGDGLGQAVQPHVPLAVGVLLVYEWANHWGPFFTVRKAAGAEPRAAGTNEPSVDISTLRSSNL